MELESADNRLSPNKQKTMSLGVFNGTRLKNGVNRDVFGQALDPNRKRGSNYNMQEMTAKAEMSIFES